MFTNSRREVVGNAVAPVMERMEERRLLSASVTLVDGDLIVAGTSRADEVEFFLNHDGTKVKVDLNGERFSFDVADVDRLVCTLKGGDDTVGMSDKNGVLDLMLKARGGIGNDTLIGGALADKLIGEYGDDLLQGYGGVDLLIGEEGRDLLDGGLDVDVIIGGLGDDAEFDVNDVLDDLDEWDDDDGVIEIELDEVDGFLDNLFNDDDDDDDDGIMDKVKDFFDDLF